MTSKKYIFDGQEILRWSLVQCNAEGVAGALQCAFLRAATATWPGRRCGCSLRHLLALAGRVLVPRYAAPSAMQAFPGWEGWEAGTDGCFCLSCFIYSHEATAIIVAKSNPLLHLCSS